MLHEFDAFTPESIKMRRRRIATMKGHVRPAKVIGDDKDDVRLCSGCVKRG
jgi:hypothetical protein